MNERIRELAKQAVEDAAKYCQRRFDLDREENETFALSLAELIVKECADIALKSGSVTNKSAVAVAEADRIYHKINEHFGVE